jgi:hypothetical protein
MANYVKRNGQLVEDTDGTLKDRVDKLSLGTSPTTALGAQTIGAKPKAVDMAGTKAHKDAVIREQAAPKEQTLEGAQRLQTGVAPAPREADVKAQEKAAQISEFGTLGGRVQAKIEGLAELVVDESILTAQGLDLATGTLRQDFQTFLADPKNQTNLVALLDSIQAQGGSTTEVVQYLQSAGQITGDQAAEAIQDTFTMADLATPEELVQMEALVPGATSMSLPQFEAALEAIQAEEFDRVAELRAEAAALPKGSARLKILQRELAALGAAGATGAEELVDRAIEQIDMADSIIIGGKEYTIEEFLKDDNISDLIESYLDDPENPDHLFNQEEAYAELRQWALDNVDAVEDLQDAAKATQENQVKAQETWDTWNTEYSDFMDMFGFDAESVATSDSVASMTARMQGSSIGQLILQAGTEEGAIAQQHLDDLLKGGPNVKNWSRQYRSAEELMDAMAVVSAAVGAGVMSPDSVLVPKSSLAMLQKRVDLMGTGTKLFGDAAKTLSPRFLMWSADQDETTQEFLASIGANPLYADTLASSFVQDLVMSGTIDASNVDILELGGAEIEALYEEWRNEPAGQGISTQDILTDIYGEGNEPNQREIMELLEDAEEAAALGSQHAEDAVEVYKKLLAGDFNIRGGSLKDFLANGGETAAGTAADAAIATLQDALVGYGSDFSDLPQGMPATLLDDMEGGLSSAEVANYSDAEIAALYADDAMKDKLPNYDAVVQNLAYDPARSQIPASTLNAIQGINVMSEFGIQNLSQADYNEYAEAITFLTSMTDESAIKDILGLDETSPMTEAIAKKLREDADEALDKLIAEGLRRSDLTRQQDEADEIAAYEAEVEIARDSQTRELGDGSYEYYNRAEGRWKPLPSAPTHYEDETDSYGGELL